MLFAGGRVLTTTGKAKNEAEEFIESSRVFLKEDYLPKLIHCVENMSDDDIWWRPNEQSNSVGNLILHLCGNLRQWIINSMGGGHFHRDRDAEFASRGPVSKEELLGSIRATIDEVDRVFATVPRTTLLEHFSIQGYSTTGLHAIYHVVEHFAMHYGQILYVAKLIGGKDLGFYRNLSGAANV
jgi:uncharacterized damage-inducible protein DinB